MDKTSIVRSPPIYYTIYRITNKVNGKVYVGKHKTTDLKDRYLGSGKMVRRAIKKYGPENFVKEILFIFDTEEEMNEKEKEIVTEEFCRRKDTYNLCSGGQGGWSYINRNGNNNAGKDWNAIRAKLSEMSRGRRNPKTSETLRKRHAQGLIRHDTFTGRSHSEESKRKIGEANAKNSGEKNSQFGTCWVTNGIEVKKIKVSDLPMFLDQGFVRGRK